MKGIKIDRQPPAVTGNQTTDARAITDYLNYLRETLNFALTQIYKNTGGNGNGEE